MKKPIRPVDASREALAFCLEWIEACRKLGWHESQMDALEGMFWKYRDKHTGQLKRKPAPQPDASRGG